MEGYNDIPYKEVRWTITVRDPITKELIVKTAVAVVEHGVVKVSEEIFDKMMMDIGFVKETD